MYHLGYYDVSSVCVSYSYQHARLRSHTHARYMWFPMICEYTRYVTFIPVGYSLTGYSCSSLPDLYGHVLLRIDCMPS